MICNKKIRHYRSIVDTGGKTCIIAIETAA